MKTSTTAPDPSLSRREVLRRTLLGLAAAAATSLPVATVASQALVESPEPFVPENDYPYFGANPAETP